MYNKDDKKKNKLENKVAVQNDTLNLLDFEEELEELENDELTVDMITRLKIKKAYDYYNNLW